MKRNHGLGLWVSALVALMSACGLDSGRDARPAMQRQHFEQEANVRDAKEGLVAHIVDPKDTDPAIDYKAPGNHYAWLDPGAQTNHQLLVFMPGTGVSPAVYQLVQREAARLGYHVIGLMYANGVRLAGACPGTADPNACFEDSRLEILDGIHRDRSVVNVDVPNSINNRLPKLLKYLHLHHPEEGWSRFLAQGQPRWRRIAVGGHSQGGGQAALIAKLHLVARVVLFSAVPDRFRATGTAPWVGTLATPSTRHWGLAHDRDPMFVPIHASWDLLGMAAFGGDKAPETIDAPYGFTHMLVTDLVPQGGSFIAGAHSAPVGDDFTPLSADGTPLLRDAWRYMLGAQDGDGDDDEGEDETRPVSVVQTSTARPTTSPGSRR
jgi:hypothetical protein